MDAGCVYMRFDFAALVVSGVLKGISGIEAGPRGRCTDVYKYNSDYLTCFYLPIYLSRMVRENRKRHGLHLESSKLSLWNDD